MAVTSTHSRATLQAVADIAGVSTATVARVIRGSDLVAEDTRTRVLAAIEDTGYRIVSSPVACVDSAPQTIGHVLHGISPNPFFAQVSLGLQQLPQVRV